MIKNYNSRSIKQIASGLYDAFKTYSSNSAPAIEAITQFLEVADGEYSYASIDEFLQSICPKFYNRVTSSESTLTAGQHYYSISVDIPGNQVLLFKDGMIGPVLCMVDAGRVSFLDEYDEIGQICSSLSASDTINEINQWFCRAVTVGLNTGSSISDFIYRALSDVGDIRGEIKVYIADLCNYVDKYGLLNTIKILQGGFENFVNSLKYEDDQLSFTDNTGLIPESWMSGIINGFITASSQVIASILSIVRPIIGVLASLIGQGISYVLNYLNPDSQQYVVSLNDNADHNCFHIAFYQYIADVPQFLDGSSFNEVKNLLLTEGPCVFDVPGGNLRITAYNDNCSKACIEFHPTLGITCCPPFRIKVTPKGEGGLLPCTYYECVTARNSTEAFQSIFDITVNSPRNVYAFSSHQIELSRFEEIYNDVVSGPVQDLRLSPNSTVFWQLYNAMAWFTIWRYLYNGSLKDISISPDEDYDGMSLNFNITFAHVTEFLTTVGIGDPYVGDTVMPPFALNNAKNVITTLFRVVASKVPYLKYMPVKPYIKIEGDERSLSMVFNSSGSCPLCDNELAGLDLIVNMQDLCRKGGAGKYSESTTFKYSDAIIALRSGFYGSHAGSNRNGNVYRYDVIADYIIMKYISNELLDDNDHIIPGGLMILPKGRTFSVELPKYDFQTSIIQFVILASVTLITAIAATASAVKIRKAVNKRAALKTAEIESLWNKVVKDPTNASAISDYNAAIKRWNMSYRWITGTKYSRYSYWGTSQGQSAGLLPQPMITKIGKLIDEKFE